MFSQEEYLSRRSNLVNMCGQGLIILPAYPTRTMSNDVHYEFRQQTDLWYFTGFPEPNAIGVIEVDEEEDTTFSLFVPERDKEFEIWHGSRFGKEGAINDFGADDAYVIDDFEEELAKLLVEYDHIYYPLGENTEIDELINSKMLAVQGKRDKAGRGSFTITNSRHIMHKIRSVKTNAELKVIRRSADISAEAMTLGIAVTKPGLSERQVEAVIEYHYAKNEADRPAYPSIVGSGVNATILHYIENKDELSDGDLVLVDAGAEYQGYASDITRTWPVNGKFTKAQREIYSLVLEVQEACIEMVKPGLTIQELHDEAIKLLTTGLTELGLLEGEVDELIEEEEYKRFFMHGIGHYLGMDVHDTSSLGREYTLEEGHYFTIEPGIYLPDEDDIPEQYRGIGVRIEDDILVTHSGFENLTKNVVKSIDEIEQLVGTKEMP